ncbi:fibronectin type III domain-containing protein, partial [Candidatus Peregrinibacteria bacterium]|nr:fibronectin type III domain-containing protein [Candidatus Peregrinibacteria bacterium]
PSQIAVSTPLNGDSVNTLNIVVEGKGPTFANLIVMGGLADVTGATDKDGNFSIPVALNPAKREFTIRVRDANGASDSGPIELTLDTTAPQISSITFSPEKPGTGEKVLVVVQSDPKLKSVSLQLLPSPTSGDVTLTLSENPTASGSYQGVFSAPEDGAYQPVVTATDAAGNATEVRTTFTVGLQSLPTVQNLRGSAKSNAAALEWDGVSEKVDGYRIYVGEKPDNFLYTLDTGRVTTKATVAGLVAGRTYYFAATAVQGKRESSQKSVVLKVDVPGIVLKTTPGDGKLLLEWQTPKVSLQSYKLEYGVKPGSFSEKRMIAAKKTDDGSPQAYTLGDLINGVTYFIRLTPITVTGDELTDLITEGSGTPQANGTAFTPGASDPIPFNPDAIALSHTPKNVQSGLPGFVWFGIGALALGFCAWQWQRRKTMRQTAAFMAAIRKHYGH